MSEFDKCEERLFFITFYSPRLSNHPTHMITCDSEEDTKNFMPPLFCLSSSIVLNHLNSSRKSFCNLTKSALFCCLIFILCKIFLVSSQFGHLTLVQKENSLRKLKLLKKLAFAEVYILVSNNQVTLHFNLQNIPGFILVWSFDIVQ